MTFDGLTTAALHARLRRAPSFHSVAGSLPVLFFGDLFSARVATVGLNPSDQEYLDRNGNELAGRNRRFESLRSLGALDRDSLDSAQCERAIATMQGYYREGQPVYVWFRHLERLLEGMGLSYSRGEVAHLDLVQESTLPTWSELGQTHPAEVTALREADLPFLRWQIEAFPLTMVLCNGRTVFDGVKSLLAARVTSTGHFSISPPGVTWHVAEASVAGRDVRLIGWNRPLARPTGLGAVGERALGELLARKAGMSQSP